ncbi:hypothetical protein EJ06DRAFT_200610 [Trichodelitschia bisporula]|uniref:VOC domain-containing protein n=1 Tax=Trichodelitschia bisporula TaxID=703511 RepID=A0A6G1I8M4_9PEZI|nr:hypothetical protein EJ06DRAFT_200610 [Trichodelitschia bisporula]
MSLAEAGITLPFSRFRHYANFMRIILQPLGITVVREESSEECIIFRFARPPSPSIVLSIMGTHEGYLLDPEVKAFTGMRLRFHADTAEQVDRFREYALQAGGRTVNHDSRIGEWEKVASIDDPVLGMRITCTYEPPAAPGYSGPST